MVVVLVYMGTKRNMQTSKIDERCGFELSGWMEYDCVANFMTNRTGAYTNYIDN